MLAQSKDKTRYMSECHNFNNKDKYRYNTQNIVGLYEISTITLTTHISIQKE